MKRIVLITLIFFSQFAIAARDVPPSPRHYISDQATVLDEKTLGGINRLLIEHKRITGEQVVVSIFKELGDEDVVDFTNRIFKEWKIGTTKKNNGVLLVLYWKEHKARIEVGYGLEPLLTDSRSKEIIDDTLVPFLKDQNPDQALVSTVLEILKTIESPIVLEGRAQSILQASHMRSSVKYGASRGQKTGLIFWIALLFPVIFLIKVLFDLFRFERGYAASGLQHGSAGSTLAGFLIGILPYLLGGRGGGGGWSGGSGGGDGFGGDGGSSGGGGASGDW